MVAPVFKMPQDGYACYAHMHITGMHEGCMRMQTHRLQLAIDVVDICWHVGVPEYVVTVISEMIATSGRMHDNKSGQSTCQDRKRK